MKLEGTIIRKPRKAWEPDTGFVLKTEAGLTPIFTGTNGVPIQILIDYKGRDVEITGEVDSEGWINRITHIGTITDNLTPD